MKKVFSTHPYVRFLIVSYFISALGVFFAGIQKYFSRFHKSSFHLYLKEYFTDPLVMFLFLGIPMSFMVAIVMIDKIAPYFSRFQKISLWFSSYRKRYLQFLLGVFLFLPLFIYFSLFLANGFDGISFHLFFQIFFLVLPIVFLAFGIYEFVVQRLQFLSLQLLSSQARYQVLMQQMQPHFLFNSLNSLAALIEKDAKQASCFALSLSDLYRAILENGKFSKASLSSELKIITLYLEMEKWRFKERLEVIWDIEDHLSQIKIPSLMLQTLVENAMKHGIAKSIQGGILWISVRQISCDQFEIQIGNTGKSLLPFQTNMSQTGLANTKQRLDILYGTQHQFYIGTENFSPCKYRGTLVRFRIHGR